MQKIKREELEKRIKDTRAKLLAAIDGVELEILERPNTIARYYSVLDILGYLAQWGDLVNKALRDIQRRKKPTDVERALDNPKKFQENAVSEMRGETLTDLLFELEGVMYGYSDRLVQFSHEDLNNPKRIRFLGNKPLWPYIAKLTYEHESEWVTEIEHYVKRATG